MKKIFQLLFLTVILAAALLPFLAFGQGPIDCCRTKHKIEVDSGQATAEYCLKNQIAGPAGASCSISAITCPVSATGTGSDRWGIFCAIDVAYTLIDWSFYFLIAFAVIMSIWGGFEFMTAGASGAAETWQNGSKKIFWAGAGLLIALLAKVVPALVVGMLK